MPAFEWEKPVLELEARITELKQFVHSKEMDFSAEIRSLERKASQLRKRFTPTNPFQRVTMARHPKRPTTRLYRTSFDDFTGSTATAVRDDQAIVGGIALLKASPLL